MDLLKIDISGYDNVADGEQETNRCNPGSYTYDDVERTYDSYHGTTMTGAISFTDYCLGMWQQKVANQGEFDYWAMISDDFSGGGSGFYAFASNGETIYMYDGLKVRTAGGRVMVEDTDRVVNGESCLVLVANTYINYSLTRFTYCDGVLTNTVLLQGGEFEAYKVLNFFAED